MKQQRWSLPPNKGDNMPDRAELTDQSTKACSTQETVKQADANVGNLGCCLQIGVCCLK